jgi:hypothetical protein
VLSVLGIEHAAVGGDAALPPRYPKALGIEHAAVGGDAALPPRYPKALLTRKTHAALKDVARLATRLAAMDRHDRDVVFQLERRRLKLALDNTPLAISEIHSSSQTPVRMGYMRHGARVYSESDADITRVPALIFGKPYIRTADRITLGGNAAPPSQGYGANYVVAVRRQWVPPEAQEHKEDVSNNYRTSMGGQQPKGVGTARIGDPVLNKYDKSIYRRRCEVEGDCITSDWRTLSNAWKNDDGHRLRQRFWRNTKQVDRSIDISANQDMKEQLAKLISDTQSSIGQCGAQFKVVSDEAVHHCERRAVRHTCYIFQSQSQVCDDASASRHNSFDGTVYFARSGLPSACQSEQRKHLVRLCDWAEKLPGVAMSHWPWQVNFCKTDLLYEEKSPTTYPLNTKGMIVWPGFPFFVLSTILSWHDE